MKKHPKNSLKPSLNKVTIMKLDAHKMQVLNGGGNNTFQSTMPTCDLTPVTSTQARAY